MYKESVYKLKEALFRRGAKDENTFIREIGYEWESFGGVPGDEARRIDTGTSESYAILYKCSKGFFPKHKHKNNEAGIVITGYAHIKTPTESYTVREGETWFIEKGVWHEFEFGGGFLSMINWHPPFESGQWEGKQK